METSQLIKLCNLEKEIEDIIETLKTTEIIIFTDDAQLWCQQLFNKINSRLSMHIMCMKHNGVSMEQMKSSFLIEKYISNKHRRCSFQDEQSSSTSNTKIRPITIEICEQVITDLIVNLYNSGCGLIYERDYYVVSIVSKVCQCSGDLVNMVAECIRHMLHINISISDDFLQYVIYERIPIVGHELSPITSEELDACKHYLGTRKIIFIRLMFQICYEFSRSEKLIIGEEHHRCSLPDERSSFGENRLSIDEIITVCNGLWFRLLTWMSM